MYPPFSTKRAHERNDFPLLGLILFMPLDPNVPSIHIPAGAAGYAQNQQLHLLPFQKRHNCHSHKQAFKKKFNLRSFPKNAFNSLQLGKNGCLHALYLQFLSFQNRKRIGCPYISLHRLQNSPPKFSTRKFKKKRYDSCKHLHCNIFGRISEKLMMETKNAR